MIVPCHKDPWNLRLSKWDQKKGITECVIRCMIEWCAIYLPYGLRNIYSPSLRLSSWSLSPSPLQSSLYLCIHAIAGYSTKLSGSGGGENRIFPPHHGTLYSSWICCCMLNINNCWIEAASSVSNGSGFEPQKWFSSVPEPSKNPTCCILDGQTLTRIHQPTGCARFC